MSIYRIAISHREDDNWEIDMPNDATAGEAIDALTMHLCFLSQSIGIDPGLILADVQETLVNPDIHIHQDLDRSEDLG